VTADILPVNSLEEEFLSEYLGGALYSADAVWRDNNESHRKNGKSLYIAFEERLQAKYLAVSETDLIDFTTRFTYVRIEDGVAYKTKQPERAMCPFTRGKSIARLGVLRDGELRGDDDTVLARRVGGVSLLSSL
jgi:hypothetical protein